LAIADSKELYTPGAGIGRLERGLLACLSTVQRMPSDWNDLWEILRADPSGARDELPWYQSYDRCLPADVSLDDVTAAAAHLSKTLQTTKTELCAIRSRAVFPREFNTRTAQFGTKGAALSHTTLELLASILEPLDKEAVHVVCDKHGGRNRYQELLEVAFPDTEIEIDVEGRAESRYRFPLAERPVEIAFRRRGEEFLPAALASMACKYLREICMEAFNIFWSEQIPGLRPTAGYPLDAKRFRREIGARQRELQIDDSLLWRKR
jgi:hypothetical protein